ncbi:hypothetical protein LWM68_29905 [Niabella sp. W65]|nr:hypothetical protein [Niabella sp. W65]MCH7366606.1 hypothetical protein [Niabella sp. W65]
MKNNRIFQADHMITVPWTNKQLKVEYSSFRDKTLPGAEEKMDCKNIRASKRKNSCRTFSRHVRCVSRPVLPHQWNAPYIWRNHYSNYAWTGNTNFGHLQARLQNSLQWGRKTFDRQYDRLYWDNSWGGPIGLAGAVPSVRVKGRVNNDVLEEVAIIGYGTQRKQSVTGAVTNMSADAMASAPAAALEQESKQSLPATTDNSAAPVRTNFNETAFFFPDLKTDKEGNISFSFTMPEALTKWKFQALTHTKDLAFGYSSREIVTKKT